MNIQYLAPLLGYLLGSIPFGFILVKWSQGTDIRTVASGNIGATNVFRKSRWAGILTLLLDAGKGYLAVVAAGWLGASPEWRAAAGFAAIAGHIFTFWLRFKGGKGVATGCGVYLAISPIAVLPALGVFLITVIATRYISLASILAAATFPLWAYLFHESPMVLLYALLGSLLIIFKHHQNIRRILAGTEHKFATRGRT
jgi:acyl phosphate:glycerol-3-phosphate acyltransferase